LTHAYGRPTLATYIWKREYLSAAESQKARARDSRAEGRGNKAKRSSATGDRNRSARNGAERYARRHDPYLAQAALKGLWPTASIRRAASSFIATSINVAHAEAPSAWELTLHPDCIRLNVGQVAVIDLYSDRAHIYAVHGQRPRGAGVYDTGYGNYAAVDDDSECWAFPLDALDSIAKQFAARHHALIRTAARAKRVSPFKLAHSPGAVVALAALSRKALPTPDYATLTPFDGDVLVDDQGKNVGGHTNGGWATRPSKAVEQAAVRVVAGRLEADGWKVRSVETELCGYDLHCVRRGKTLHVEVKGSAGPPARFMVTRNELRRAELDARFEHHLVGLATNAAPVIRRWRGRALLDEHVIEPTQFELRPSRRGRGWLKQDCRLGLSEKSRRQGRLGAEKPKRAAEEVARGLATIVPSRWPDEIQFCTAL